MSTSQTPTEHRLPTVATRSERVAQRSAAHGFFSDVAVFLKNDHRGKFIVLMLLTSIVLACVVGAWNPPFRYRINDVADRAIVCNTPFSVISREQTLLAVDRARTTAPHVFVNDLEPLVQLRKSLWNTVAQLCRANSYDELEEPEQSLWSDFLRPNGHEEIPEHLDVKTAFTEFVSYFNNEINLEDFQSKLQSVFSSFENRGILIRIPFGPEYGNQDTILVYPKQDTSESAVECKVSEVLLSDGAALKHALYQEMGSSERGDQLFNWIYPKIFETLSEDKNTTARIAEEAAEKVENVVVEYTQGQILISAGTVLQRSDINLLFTEYTESLNNRASTAQCVRLMSVSGVFFLVLVIMVTLVFRAERRRPHSSQAFFFLMLSMIVTVAAARCAQWTAFTGAEWEILPLMLFVMLVSIVYAWELAMILSIFLTIVIVCGNGGNVDLLIILLGTSVVTAVQLGRLRSRGTLVVVSVISGLVAFSLTIALGIQWDRFWGERLYVDAAVNFLWAFLAGLLMTGILPFIEKQFAILTDMGLLELGDVSHPLIQELVKVAPATYGHCTQVGSIAETAADTIGARGLLTRVGAYFHDIGKIMKPEYFSENQGGMINVHDTLEPQLSSIVLIAHVKDGVDMARQFHLPKPLIDLIEQHHGTSLISFFYGRATKGGKEEVEESTFRYPGPKPQSKEAAILMIADTCESACRSMGMGVPPNKVEAKIRALIKQKLDDGQFDDSGLTLNELKIVEKSVVNSIVAAMHGRIQYPEGVEKHDHHHDNDHTHGEIYLTGIHRADRMG